MIVKALFKVVIDDIEHEIYCTEQYINDLQTEIKRFEQIEKYKEKMEKSKKEKDRTFYLEGIKMLLKENENLENYPSLWEEYKNAYQTRKSVVDNLNKEIKTIKKLKI